MTLADINCVVPQGFQLGPLFFFFIYVNDLKNASDIVVCLLMILTSSILIITLKPFLPH